MKSLCVSVHVFVFLLIALDAAAQQGDGDERSIELYEAPIALERVPPVYPVRAAARRAEGWVRLNFMVSSEGEPYEIYVIDNVGEEAFINAAVRALERTEFEPARIGDRIVDGSSSIRFIFVMEDGGDGVRGGFLSRYEQFLSALAESSQSEAAVALEELEAADIHNHYEFAYLNLANYSYALRHGTPIEQMEYLERALGESLDDPGWESPLEVDAAREARRALLQLQLVNSYFREAMETYEIMRLRGDAEGAEIFRGAIEQLEAFQAGPSAFPVAGQIEDSGSWHIGLLKTRFYFSDLEGTVEELKLRCHNGYVFFEFDPELQYDVADAAGECRLQVIGDPGTTFTLVQAN